MSRKFVQVALNIPVHDVFDYAVPPHLSDAVAPGKRVRVPFRTQTMVGCVVAVNDRTSIPRVRDVESVIDETPLLGTEMLALTRWLADYYYCSWGEAIEAAIPVPFKKGRTSMRIRAAAATVVPSTSRPAKNILTTHQDSALVRISRDIEQATHEVFLLHGITASGKTEVYFCAIEAVLQKGKTALVFIPEIALTPQTWEWFVERFGEDLVAVIHSKLSAGEKFTQWQRIREGTARIVIGPRSALFSPLCNVGLVVVDEEQEPSYKQEDAPRYHLVPAAIRLAQIHQAVVILGSATPSLESYHQAQQGAFRYIELPERISGKQLPQVQIVDMHGQPTRGRRRSIISRPLEDAISRCLDKKQQVILFLNRRGFSTYTSCQKCGHVMQCKRCSVALIYHFDEKMLVCHHCEFRVPASEVCPQCQGEYLRYQGVGTQKVESELHRLFPQAAIRRLDADAVTRKAAYFELFQDFKAGKIDIMVGTQMLAKGLDFPNVTLVGVVSADVTLNVPDFRAAERTFSLLTQVAGRAGRGDAAGRVIIQTYTPEHYAIRCAVHHDYRDFYAQEMVFRKELNLPPTSHLVMVTIRGRQEVAVQGTAEEFFQRAQKKNTFPAVSMIGPAALPLARLRGYYRWAVIFKTPQTLEVNALLDQCLSGWKPAAGVKLSVDVDPLGMM